MLRLPVVIAIMFCLPHVARAEDVDEQQGPNSNHHDHDSDDRDRAARLPNCNEVAVLPCFELVWVDGFQLKMAFFDLDVQTNPPTHNFYVVAPQTDTPQGIAPFLHDHVVGDDDATYWRGFLALCSAQGISSGACVASPAGGDLPFARTVHGQKLTTTDPIEAAARAGLIVLVDTGAVLLARVDHCARHHHRVPDRR